MRGRRDPPGAALRFSPPPRFNRLVPRLLHDLQPPRGDVGECGDCVAAGLVVKDQGRSRPGAAPPRCAWRRGGAARCRAEARSGLSLRGALSCARAEALSVHDVMRAWPAR
jgi:hypothetical protein